MQLVVDALISSLPMMTDIVFLAMFYYAVFGIICLQIFMGQLEYRCGAPDFTSSYVATGQVIRVSAFTPSISTVSDL